MKEWICREMSTATRDSENGILTMETELIRCKDCKYKNEYGYCTFYLNFHRLTADMDYCSDAERKEENESV